MRDPAAGSERGAAAVYAPANLVLDVGWYAIWRLRRAAGDIVGVRIDGELTDERNPVWRAAVDAHCDAAGWPKRMALDVRTAIPMASLPRRLQSAMWGRKVLSTIERGVVGVGPDARLGLTVRAIMRVVGMSNVAVVDDKGFDEAVARLVEAA